LDRIGALKKTHFSYPAEVAIVVSAQIYMGAARPGTLSIFLHGHVPSFSQNESADAATGAAQILKTGVASYLS